MDIKYRRILYLISTLVFLVTVPPLLMYALGMTYNLKKHKIEFNGGVYLQFKPKNAMVSVDGVTYNKQSPFELTSLYPGAHSVSLELSGYHSWSKLIRVSPQQTVTFSSVTLFPSVLPERIIQSPSNNTTVDIRRRELLSEFSIEPARSGYTVTQTSTNASTTIPLATTTEYWIVPKTLTALVFDEEAGRLALIDGSRTSLATQLFEKVKNITHEKTVTLFWTPFELWAIHEGAPRPELVTRVSEEIVAALLYNEHYAIYATQNGSVYATELLQLFGRNRHQLASLDSIESLELIDDSTLHIKGTLTKTSDQGWFSLRLQ